MQFDTVMKRAAIGATVDLSLRGIEDDPRRSMKNAVDLFGHMTEDIFGKSLMAKIRREAENPRSCFYRMVTAMVRNVDHSVLKTVGTDMCFNRVAILVGRPKSDEPNRILPLPAPPEELGDAVHHAKEAGIFFFVICGRRPLLYRDQILNVCKKNRDCAFYITAEEGDIDDSLANSVVEAGNVILSVRINTRLEPNSIAKGCSHSFQILKKRNCLFGYIAEIGSSAARSCCSDGFIRCMAKEGCLFGWYYISDSGKKFSSCRSAIKRLMDSALTSRSKPLLLLCSETDRAIRRRFVTGGRCYLLFSDRQLRVRYYAAHQR